MARPLTSVYLDSAVTSSDRYQLDRFKSNNSMRHKSPTKGTFWLAVGSEVLIACGHGRIDLERILLERFNSFLWSLVDSNRKVYYILINTINSNRRYS